MSDEPDSLVLRYVRCTDDKLDRLIDYVADLKRRMTSVEQSTALLHGDFAGQFARIELRPERIGRRLDLNDA